ncbi:hypothetical protein ACRALDRAFT_1078851 [Sodiomyces alcalophilus JCM 7366]|uniref:uncharacterized protein n=1 Tax=Sodiomyces alcalophilus JCM 7366 TaxID=591952 RepID=UPI0039B423C3
MMWPAAESLVPDTTPEPEPRRRDDDAAGFPPSSVTLPVRPREPDRPPQHAHSNWARNSVPASARHHSPSSPSSSLSSLSSSSSSSSSSSFFSPEHEPTGRTASDHFHYREEDPSYRREKHGQSRDTSTLGGLAYEKLADDSELVGAVLDGIGRITVTMRLDSGGRWRIRRESSHLEWF